MAIQIQLRRDSAADWTSADPTLAQGEVGFETDTYKFKIGDGTTAWTSLAYFASGIRTATASGTDTYTATIAGVSAYATHDIYEIIFTNGNTASSTININSLGAKTLKKSVSTNLASGDINAGQSFFIVYDGTNFQVIGLGGGGAGSINSGTQYRLAHYATAGTTLSEWNAITANKILTSDANGLPVGSYTFRDEDNMASDDATGLPSQQSVKAYVDASLVTVSDEIELAYITSNYNYTQR
jgi:hypothetical protein